MADNVMYNHNMFQDFDIFYGVAKCWLQGQNPYACGFLYPFPVIFLFLPFLAFPLEIARYVWLGVQLVLLVAVFRRKVFLWIFFGPLLWGLYLGQVDPFFIPFIFLKSGLAMAFLTLKPQLVWLYLPIWWFEHREQRRSFLISTALIYGLPLLVYPTWPLDLSTKDVTAQSWWSASLWGGWYVPPVIVIAVGVVLIAASRHKWSAVQVVNPALSIPGLVMLLPDLKLWAIPLSWFCHFLAMQISNQYPYVLLSIAVVISGVDIKSLTRHKPDSLFRRLTLPDENR